MSRTLGVAVLAVANVAGAPARAEEAALRDPPPVLRLSWTDPSRAVVGLEVFVRGEATSLIEAMGVRVRWRRAASDELARADEVRVIFLDRPAIRDGGVLVLGATPPRFAVGPHVWIHVPAVRAMLGVPAGRTLSVVGAPERRALGIALGRVVAHEVVHAVAPGVPHGRGLMSAALVTRALTAASMAADPDVGGAVQAALRGEAPRLAPGVTALAASPPRPIAQVAPEVHAHELLRGSGEAQGNLPGAHETAGARAP